MNGPDEPSPGPWQARFQTLFDLAQVGVVLADADSRYLDANPAACRMFGYTREQFIGLHASDIVVPADVPHVATALGAIHARTDHRREWRFRRSDGSVFSGDVIATAMPDGTLLGLIHDVSPLHVREREIARLSALYGALSQINHALVRVPAPEALFGAVCRALVEQGGFSVASIGWLDPGTGRLRLLASRGDDEGDLQRLTVDGGEPGDAGSPARHALRTGRPRVVNDLLADPALAGWRPVLERRGLRSGAAFPIRTEQLVRGVLSVYDSRPDVFHDREIALLEEAAADLAFGLESFARDEARRIAEAAEHSERLFSDAMIDSMPGVVYFYDLRGRFLRWNRNFETVSGYTGDEIRAMQPLDFFTGDDRARVEARIAEVFATGESSVEASFVTKAGARIPHFFTGRRVVLDGQPCLVGVGVDVSERRRVENRLAASERQYRELVELASSIILRWDAEGRVTFLNDFGLRFFGFAPEEILGRPVTETIVPATASDGRDLRARMAALRASPEAYTEHVNENVKRNGDRVWIAWSNRVVRGEGGALVEILSIGTDVTERRRAEARLRESEADLREAQRIARVGSWNLDLRTGHFRGSAQLCAMFGVDAATFDGTTAAFVDAVHPEDRTRVVEALRAARSGAAALDVEHRVVLPDGRETVVRELGSLTRDDAGVPVVLSGTAHDITDRVQMEQERERRHRAEAADRVKSAFLATMSHELRTPLNSIIGFTGILLQGLPGPLNAEQQKQLGMVRSSARHLLALVNDVLDISKIEAGQLEVARDPFDPAEAIAKVTALVGPQASAKGLALDVDVAGGAGPIVGDVRRFEQILLNLLSNAIKFTEHGRVTLRARVVDDGPDGGDGAGGPALRVEVADTGIGIRAADLPTLFQPFRQIDAGLARTHDGTGLGLAICDRLARLMGGRITADSTWREGSTFSVVLPLPPRR